MAVHESGRISRIVEGFYSIVESKARRVRLHEKKEQEGVRCFLFFLFMRRFQDVNKCSKTVL